MIPFQRKTIDFKSEVYGLIHIDAFTEEPLFDLAEEYNQFINANPRDVISTLAAKICSLDGQPIKSKFSTDIPDDLLNLFSDKFIEINSWITDSSTSHGPKIALTKKDGELSRDYLFRIICAYYNSAKDSIAKMGEEMHKIFKDSFVSKEVEESFKKNAMAAETVMKQLASINLPLIDDSFLAKMASEKKMVEEFIKKDIEAAEKSMKQLPSTLTPPFYDMIKIQPIPENPIDKTNKKLENISDGFLHLKMLIKSMAELLTSMNDLGKNMAIEFKRSAKISGRYSFVMMIIGIATLVATLIFTIINNHSTDEMNKTIMELLKNTRNNESSILSHLETNSTNLKLLMDTLHKNSSSKK